MNSHFFKKTVLSLIFLKKDILVKRLSSFKTERWNKERFY